MAKESTTEDTEGHREKKDGYMIGAGVSLPFSVSSVPSVLKAFPRE